MPTKLITLANFNCTFKDKENVYPLLDHLADLILPAITSKIYKRKVKSKSGKTTEYFLTNVKIIRLPNDELALIGEHVKRVILEIKQDYSPEEGYIPIGENIPSAPFSTFIIFLKNHRVAHLPDQPGSPDIRSFSATFNDIIRQYRSTLRINAINKLKSDKFIYNGIKLRNISEFDDIFIKECPISTINVVPIPSDNIIEEKFKLIKKVKSLKFKLYNLNSEIDDEPMFEAIKSVMNNVNSRTVNAEFPSPKDLDEVKRYATICKGKYDFTIDSRGNDKEKIIVRPDSLSEQIPLSIEDNVGLEKRSDSIYNVIKEKSEIRECASDNLQNYNKHKDNIIDLFQIKRLKGN